MQRRTEKKEPFKEYKLIQIEPQTREMGTLDLTVQVINISPQATREDLVALFNYCGTIHEIKLDWDADQTQKAKVTFRQPYAFQTALLLNNAMIVDRRVRIMPLEMMEIPISSSQSEDTRNQGIRRGSYSSTYPFNELPLTALIEGEVIAKAKDLALNTGRTLTQQAGSAIATAERMADQIGSNIINSECMSKGAVWLSGVLDKASKSLAEIGNNRKGPG